MITSPHPLSSDTTTPYFSSEKKDSFEKKRTENPHPMLVDAFQKLRGHNLSPNIEKSLKERVTAAKNASEPEVFRKEIAKIDALWKGQLALIPKKQKENPNYQKQFLSALNTYQNAVTTLKTHISYPKALLYAEERKAIYAARKLREATGLINPFLQGYHLDFTRTVLCRVFASTTFPNVIDNMQKDWDKSCQDLPAGNPIDSTCSQAFKEGLQALQTITPLKELDYPTENIRKLPSVDDFIKFYMTMMTATFEQLKTAKIADWAVFIGVKTATNRLAAMIEAYIEDTSQQSVQSGFKQEKIRAIFEIRFIFFSCISDPNFLFPFEEMTKQAYQALQNGTDVNQVFKTVVPKNQQDVLLNQAVLLFILHNRTMQREGDVQETYLQEYEIYKSAINKISTHAQHNKEGIVEQLALSPVRALQAYLELDGPCTPFTAFLRIVSVAQQDLQISSNKAPIDGYFQAAKTCEKNREVLTFCQNYAQKQSIAFPMIFSTEIVDHIPDRMNAPFRGFVNVFAKIKKEAEDILKMDLFEILRYIKDTPLIMGLRQLAWEVGSFPKSQYEKWTQDALQAKVKWKQFLEEHPAKQKEQKIICSLENTAKQPIVLLHSIFFLLSRIAPLSTFQQPAKIRTRKKSGRKKQTRKKTEGKRQHLLQPPVKTDMSPSEEAASALNWLTSMNQLRANPARLSPVGKAVKKMIAYEKKFSQKKEDQKSRIEN